MAAVQCQKCVAKKNKINPIHKYILSTYTIDNEGSMKNRYIAVFLYVTHNLVWETRHVCIWGIIIGNITWSVSGEYMKWTIYNEVERATALGSNPIILQMY